MDELQPFLRSLRMAAIAAITGPMDWCPSHDAPCPAGKCSLNSMGGQLVVGCARSDDRTCNATETWIQLPPPWLWPKERCCICKGDGPVYEDGAHTWRVCRKCMGGR